MKVLSEEMALLLTEKLLQNDRDIKEELNTRIDSVILGEETLTKDETEELISQKLNETMEAIAPEDIESLFA